MAVENTDLERRVLAHEQILQALMAQLAEGQPGFLSRMHERFANTRRGAHEHDYVETADYAEAFLHEVARLGRLQDAKAAERPSVRSHSNTPVAKASGLHPPIAIRTSRVGGVWHVTRDHVFLGDYLAEGPARDAATKAARDIADQGGHAELIFEAPR
ncbi:MULTISPECIES: hypothetical protein [Phenylobacterium]|uniref:Uncharacterized protein n=1 Tax=Phenylobacterium koreense TaxID=266125 RepID=A0ABV2EFU6_9CAUL|nr:hypothetical protein [Phenylobacterium sp. NIBR 498073]WGU41388.1 hypothetical protein O4N75_06590 [Phenylobacterium sp. NIBR 498073]